MPATEHQSSSFLNRISIRRNQVSSMENNHDQEMEDIEMFQKHVTDRLAELASPSADDNNGLLSIAWIRSLLDAFLCCEAEFKAVLIIDRDPTHFIKPPLDRVGAELQDRCVKAMDICNAVTYAIDLVHYWQKLAEIAVTSLEQRPIGDGQVARAKKVLNALLTLIADESKEQTKSTERSWSFGRRGSGTSVNNKDSSSRNFRYLNFAFARSWSAAKEIQAMSSNLVEPRGKEANGLAMPVYVMSSVLVFTMWSLVAAFPCQERNGLPTHFPVAKNLNWTQSIISLQEKIGEEWKKKEKKGRGGLLDEMQKLEKVAMSLIEFAEAFKFPAEEEKLKEVEAQVAEMSEICKRIGEGLTPLQQQIREVFHRLVRSRGEIMDLVEAGFIISSST